MTSSPAPTRSPHNDPPHTPQPLRVVVAPDSFKGSLPARQAAEIIADAWRTVRPGDEVLLAPQADGGEGTLDALAAVHVDARWYSAGPVRGPDGRDTEGRWLQLADGTAVIELAQMSGLPMMAHLQPLAASTYGLGQVIAAAVTHGCHRLVIGLGGSASTDGGAGALQALGARLRDRAGHEIGPGGGELARLHTIDMTALTPPPPGGVTLLSDVDAPLLGPAGAAHVFGPQKGADTGQCIFLDAALARFADRLGVVVRTNPAQPGVGSAGGTAFGLTAWGATLTPGADYIAAVTGLSAAFGHADLIVTGEGRFDHTSLTGKVVGAILTHCDNTSTRGVIIAGDFATDPPDGSVSLTDTAGSTAAALAQPQQWLRSAAIAVATGI